MKPDKFSKRRLPELDGLRGVAILLVLVYHYFATVGPFDQSAVTDLKAAGRLFWSGVDLFFVLSGFLIGGILIDVRGSANYFKAFYMRRVFRILPLYFVMCAAFWLGLMVVDFGQAPALRWLYEDPLPWYTYPTFTQNLWMARHNSMGSRMIDATWSLAVEEQFYLLMPLLVWYVRPSRLLYLSVAAVVLAAALRTFLFFAHPHGGTASYVLMPCRADALMLGVVAAWLVRQPRAWDYLTANGRILYALTASLLAVSALMTWMDWNIRTLPMTSLGYTALALLFFCVLLIAVTQPQSLLCRVLRFRPLMALGTLAYGVYLFHQPIHGLCHALIRRSQPELVSSAAGVVTLLAFGLTIGLAKMSWEYFEKPLVKRGHRYSYERTAEVPVAGEIEFSKR